MQASQRSPAHASATPGGGRGQMVDTRGPARQLGTSRPAGGRGDVGGAPGVLTHHRPRGGRSWWLHLCLSSCF